MSTTPDPHRIAFVGDLHDNIDAFIHTTDLATAAGASTIIQTGDFGFHHPADLELLQIIIDERDPGLNYRIIDGNHEDFTLLTPDTTEPTALTRSITYMPRGLRTTIAGINMLFLGGATSTDRKWRTEGVNWFPAEHITDAQVDRAITAASTGTGPVDILVTHETGAAAFTALAAGSDHAQTKESDPLSQADRTRIDRVLTAVHPAVHIHGHHHTRFAAPLDGELTGTLDIALAKETDDGSVVILTTHGGGPDQWTWSVPVAHRQVITDTCVLSIFRRHEGHRKTGTVDTKTGTADTPPCPQNLHSRHQRVRHTVRTAGEEHQSTVMHNPVNDRSGHRVITEHRPPPRELQIRGDHQRVLLIRCGDDLEQQPCTVGVDRQVPELIDDQQAVLPDAGELLVQPSCLFRPT